MLEVPDKHLDALQEALSSEAEERLVQRGSKVPSHLVDTICHWQHSYRSPSKAATHERDNHLEHTMPLHISKSPTFSTTKPSPSSGSNTFRTQLFSHNRKQKERKNGTYPFLLRSSTHNLLCKHHALEMLSSLPRQPLESDVQSTKPQLALCLFQNTTSASA
jgi:hypothetical protein